MTPKEKAKELYVNYYDFIVYPLEKHKNVKQCVLIAVDEMLEHVEMMDDGAAIKYWEELCLR